MSETAVTTSKMSKTTKWIIGILAVAAVGATAYYFLVYKPAQDKKKAENVRNLKSQIEAASGVDTVTRPMQTA